VDQEYYGILHSSKKVPSKLEAETNMKLEPVRMKAEHPSSTLPSTARVHYGHIYEIDHDVQVKKLGLIHDTSIQILFSQFELSTFIAQPEVTKVIMEKELQEANDISPANALPVDIDTAKNIRKSIHQCLELESHPRKSWKRRREMSKARDEHEEWAILNDRTPCENQKQKRDRGSEISEGLVYNFRPLKLQRKRTPYNMLSL
jgi:hypothetical protein